MCGAQAPFLPAYGNGCLVPTMQEEGCLSAVSMGALSSVRLGLSKPGHSPHSADSVSPLALGSSPLPPARTCVLVPSSPALCCGPTGRRA